MSLSFLLGSSIATVDKDLDNLFKSSTKAATTSKSPSPGKHEKRRHEDDAHSAGKKDGGTTQADKPTKRKRVSFAAEDADATPKGDARVPAKDKKRKEKKDQSGALMNVDEKQKKKKVEQAAAPTDKQSDAKTTKNKTRRAEIASSGSEGEEDDPHLEDAYLASKNDSTSSEKVEDEATRGSADENDDNRETSAAIVHESLQPKTAKSKGSSKKSTHVPEDETPEQRNARTIFVGNVPLQVAQKRPLVKQLHRHILAHLPNAKIESSRVRSVPFQNPTSKLPDEEDAAVKKGSSKEPPSTDTRAHDRERAASWRQQQQHQQGDEDPKSYEDPSKKFLTPNQKKKVAFINQNFHSEADSINVYVVFAHPPEASSAASHLPPSKHTMDPYEAARVAKDKCDGTLFMERLLRVDIVGSSDGSSVISKGAKTTDGDPKLSVFVGNLDFASKEEDLRAFVESVIVGELGPRQKDTDDPSKPNFWVTRVRIVRDKETQLGKGFAYVQFAARECVDEILALDASKLSFAKRTLRVQRCKTLPSKSSSAPKSSDPPTTTPPTRAAARPVSVPKGDPSLGERLAHLSKEDRKAAKSSDADRVNRRLAKKKARMSMVGATRPDVQKIGGTGGGAKIGKVRNRERKTKQMSNPGVKLRKKGGKAAKR